MPKPAVQSNTPNIEVCSVLGIHKRVVLAVQAKMPDPEKLDKLAGFYKLFGNKTRLRLIWALGVSEMCVCDLCAVLGMQQAAISHQLSTMKRSRIVKSRRDGRVIFYSLEADHISSVLKVGLNHLQEY